MENWQKLSQIADQLADLGKTDWKDPFVVAGKGGKLLKEAQELGAFSSESHARLRSVISDSLPRPDNSMRPDTSLAKHLKNKWIRTWDTAVYCLQETQDQREVQHTKLGCYQRWFDACSQFAGIVRADAQQLTTQAKKSEGNRQTAASRPRRRKRKLDPKRAARKRERQEQEKLDKAIFEKWRGNDREHSYSIFADSMNNDPPKDWPCLDAQYVTKAIGRYKARLKRAGKWPPGNGSK